jgi:transcriptional regulator with XRE-family HTH domain
MMRPAHLRMARAALNWTLRDLEVKAGVNKNTISRYEAGGAIMSNTLDRLEAVLRAEGVVFIEEDQEFGPGIRLRLEHRLAVQPASKMPNEKTKPKKTRKRTD